MLKHMERLSFLHKVSHVRMIQDCKNRSMKTSIHSLCRLFHKLRDLIQFIEGKSYLSCENAPFDLISFTFHFLLLN